MKKYIPCKWEAKESWSSNPHITQNKPWNKEYYERKRRTLHNDQGINPTGRHNNCKYALYIGATQYIRQTLTDIKGEIDSNTIIGGDLNIPLTPK